MPNGGTASSDPPKRRGGGEDGKPGEIFLRMSKEGSTISGLMDSFATAISMALQYGVPLRVLVDKFSHTRFEPSGFTGNPAVPIAKSIAALPSVERDVDARLGE